MQRDMEYAYMVYKAGSFSKAAELLFASQPAVSLAVRRVEEDLGHLIFDRSTHPLQLTEVGKLYFEHVDRIVDSEQSMHQKLEELSNLHEGQLRIGCTPMHSTCLIPAVLSRFNQIQPGIKINVVNVFPKEMHSMLKDNMIDIALSTKLDSDETDYFYIPAFKVQYLIAVPEKHPVNAKLAHAALSAEDIISRKYLLSSWPSVDLSEFEELPYIMLSEGTDFYIQLCHIFSEVGFTPNIKYTVSTPAMSYSMAVQGMGVTMVGSFSVSPNAPLKYYLPRTKFGERPFYFILRNEEGMTAVQRSFIQVFQDHISR